MLVKYALDPGTKSCLRVGVFNVKLLLTKGCRESGDVNYEAVPSE